MSINLNLLAIKALKSVWAKLHPCLTHVGTELESTVVIEHTNHSTPDYRPKMITLRLQRLLQCPHSSNVLNTVVV